MTITTDVNSSGLQPTAPSVLLSELITLVASTNPGYTADLPGSLISDIAETDVGALSLIDSARVDLFNSITPYSANSFLLNQLGKIYGVQQGVGSNTSVYVTFSGSVGFVIPSGFTVSDGSKQYTVQDGGIIASNGQSAALYCLSNTSGSWAVPIGTVTTIITSIPSAVSLTCTNQTAGVPGLLSQTLESYRAQVIQAGLVTSQGVPTFVKSQLQNVSGVQQNLVSVRLITNGQWEVICGGGDPYNVANAIFSSIPDISMLVGSTLEATKITNSSNGIVTTNLNHGFTSGQVIEIENSNPSTFNGLFTITVLSQTTFNIGVDTSSFGSYVSGGIITPNLRNITVSINDYPDTYNITFVNPPVQTVSMVVTWNTISTNLVSNEIISSLSQPALAAYINGIYVGQPINVFELQNIFQTSIQNVIPANLISRMVFIVAINGIDVPPESGTGLIYGDPESYFSTSSANIVVNQG